MAGHQYSQALEYSADPNWRPTGCAEPAGNSAQRCAGICGQRSYEQSWDIRAGSVRLRIPKLRRRTRVVGAFVSRWEVLPALGCGTPALHRGHPVGHPKVYEYETVTNG